MKITTVVEVRNVQEFDIGTGSHRTVGEIIDMKLGDIVENHRNHGGNQEEHVKEIIIDVQQFIKEVI